MIHLPSGRSAFARHQREKGRVVTDNSINNDQNSGRREPSWAAGRQMVPESMSDARQLLRIPAQAGADTQTVDPRNKLLEEMDAAAGLTLSWPQWPCRPTIQVHSTSYVWGIYVLFFKKNSSQTQEWILFCDNGSAPQDTLPAQLQQLTQHLMWKRALPAVSTALQPFTSILIFFF